MEHNEDPKSNIFCLDKLSLSLINDQCDDQYASQKLIFKILL